MFRITTLLTALCFFNPSAFAQTTSNDLAFETPVSDTTQNVGEIKPVAIAAPGDGGGDTPSSFSSELGTEELNKLKTTDSITPHTTELFGERIDLNTGSISFSHVDVSLPGNNNIEVAVRRTFRGTKFTWADELEFADWQLDIPYIHTIQSLSSSGYSGSWAKGKECSGYLEPRLVSYLGTTYDAQQYWTGDTLHVPSKVDEKLLINDGVIAPGSYGKVTMSNWRVSCGSRTENGQPVGETFIVSSPDGLTYTFGKLKRVEARPLNGGLMRYNTYMLVTQVKDRFNNTVNYHYNGANLAYISSNDGRRIDFSYADSVHPNRITSVTANGRTWQYTYATSSLRKVYRPDGKYWDLLVSSLGDQQPASNTSCTSYSQSYPISMTHPDGMTASFTIKNTLHGRSNVPRQVQALLAPKDMSICYQTLALKSKTLSSDNTAPVTWQYSYSQNHGDWDNASNTMSNLYYSPKDNTNTSRGIPATAHVLNSKTTSVVAPDGSKTVYFYNRDYTSHKEGQLEAIDNFDTNGTTLLRRKEITQLKGQRIGLSGITGDNTQPQHYRINTSQEKITVYDQGTQTFTTSYNSFDIYGNPQITSESNNFNGKKRYTKQLYYNDTTNWLIGLPKQTLISSTPTFPVTPASETTYHSATGNYKSLPYEHRSFGRWYKRNTRYHTSGVNAGLPYTVNYNGTNRWVEFSNYKRGIAQTIKTPQSLSATPQYAYKVVDNNGWVTQQTDFMGQCINYGYDSLGRMILVDPCDSRWSSTNITYATTAGSDSLSYVEADMLKKTVTRGNYQKITYHDSLLRPVMIKEWDKTFSSTARYSRQQFDAFNRPLYQSLPNSSSNTPYGVTHQYDGLGRPTLIDNNTTSGNISYRYLSNNRVQVNDNKGNVTTTTYLAYGAPEQNMATLIISPHSVNTSLAYNIYGNMSSVSQGGITESRVYDSYQQLCKTVRPDIGNTAFVKDALGQVSWQARGSSIDSSTTTCDTTVSATDKAIFAYDNLGNVKSILFGDSSPDQSYVYDANSRLTTLNAGSVVTAYEYNSANLIELETLSVDGQSFVLDYGYSSNGNLANTLYPSGVHITYSPNALGQATKAGTYATSATYHANGMVKSHNYGNGFAHTSSQNNSGLPSTFYDKRSTTYAINHGFSYDANNNLTVLDDKINNAYDLSLSYDGLDRLDVITDSYLGAGDVNYDAMGNITDYKLGNKTINYVYTSTKQLDYTTGSKIYDFNYDDKGNVTDNGIRGFIYNAANQMVQSDGYLYTYDGNNKRVKEQGSNGTSYSFYASNGKLMYRQANNQHIEYYYLGGKLVANKKGSTVTYLHSDYLGSTAAESNTSGTVTSRMHYQPFGESIEPPKDDIGYTGHKFDTDLGLSYMQARYYDPVIGRFYSNDPVGTLGHLYGSNGIHGFNRYAYANNNPYKYIDPTGMAPESLEEWGNLGIGALGAVGALGEAGAGVVLTGVGAVDLIAGSKVGGSLAIAGGIYLVHDSKYTFDNASNKIKDAWNNETGLNKTSAPEGPLQSTAQDLGCSTSCQSIAGNIDKGIEVAAGRGASKATSGMTTIQVANTAGDAASAADKLQKTTENFKER